jgi:predicted enzyme related to lactoylglutathione lyase
MGRVTGIGGIFFYAKNPQLLHDWYKKNLGIDIQDWGGTVFTWEDENGDPTKGTSVFSIADIKSDQFAPSKANFMINFRVDNVTELVNSLRSAGCQVLDEIQESEYGKFGWVIDPEGNKIELWQPPVGQ